MSRAAAATPRDPELAGRAGRKVRLRLALLLTAGVLIVEVAGGLLSHSLALLADAAHMFTDVAALLLAYAGMTLGERAPTRRHTFGFVRAEVLAAFVNAQILLVASLGILWESWSRFRAPAPIQTRLMLGVAAVGLVANAASIRLLRAGREKDLNLKAAYVEVLTDALASVAVLIGALVMARTGWYGLDALLSGAIALMILPRGFGILREAAHILLEGAPADVDLSSLRNEILSVPGVEAIHDLHFWTLASGLHSASLHICAEASRPRDDVLARVQGILRDRAGVDHATIQVEQGEESPCASTPSHA